MIIGKVTLMLPSDYREWRKPVAENRAVEGSGAGQQKLKTGQAQGV